MAVKKKYSTALGRGLDEIKGQGIDALIPTTEVHVEGSSSIHEVDIDRIMINPNQPRREFDQEALEELATSIREIGIIQPITLRQMPDGNYQIIAGERRFRASQIASLKRIPAYIRTAGDEDMMEMALIENIQREDLNSIEIALAYQNLLEQYDMTQEKLSQRMGKKRATIANYLRLLRLPAPVQMGLQNKDIDMGHARALLALESTKEQLRLFEETKRLGHSVRKVEQLVKAYNEKRNTELINKVKPVAKDENILGYKDRMAKLYKTKVNITSTPKGAGKIVVPFSSREDMMRILALMGLNK